MRGWVVVVGCMLRWKWMEKVVCVGGGGDASMLRLGSDVCGEV